MRSLWRDVREHRSGAVLLLVWWVALLAGEMFVRAYSSANLGRLPPVASVLTILSPAFPFVAAIVAGWWRATAQQSGSWLGRSILSGLLLGQISCVAFALCIWGFESLIGPLVGAGDAWRSDEPALAWVIIFFVLGSVIGALGGTVGGLAARAYWRARGEQQENRGDGLHGHRQRDRARDGSRDRLRADRHLRPRLGKSARR